MSFTDDAISSFELPKLNLRYFRYESFPNQEAKLSKALLDLCTSDEDHRDDFIPVLAQRLEAYRNVGRFAGVEFPTELEQSVVHALGLEE